MSQAMRPPETSPSHSSRLAGAKAADATETLGRDPYLARSFLRIEPDAYTKIKVRMKLSGGNTEGQLFWSTETEPAFGDDKYLNFPIQPDGEWHEYVIPVGDQNPLVFPDARVWERLTQTRSRLMAEQRRGRSERDLEIDAMQELLSEKL